VLSGAGDGLIELAGDGAFEATDGFAAGLALGDGSVEVVAGVGVPAQAGQDDGGERGVGLPVAAAVEAAALVLPEDASMGLTPHSAAKDASLWSRSGLSPAATRRAAVVSGPTPERLSSLGVWAVIAAVIRS
jgi:hypothetical protein